MKFPKMSFALLAASTALVAPMAAQASTMEGACYVGPIPQGTTPETYKMGPLLDGKVVEGNTLKCNKGTWTDLGSGHSTGDANGFVALYVDEGKTTDSKIQLRLRPRKSSECLVNVRWSTTGFVDISKSHACDTDYKTGVNYDRVTTKVDADTGKTTKTFSGQVTTSTKAHKFAVVYMIGEELDPKNKAGDKALYQIGVFIEDK